MTASSIVSCHKDASVNLADVIFINGRIYTVEPDKEWVEALAIRDGKFIAVGDKSEALSFKGESTRVVDLQGQMAMPGLIDAHIHPSRGALMELYTCNFPFSATPAQIKEVVGACVDANPNAEWIKGGQWSSVFFDKHPMESPRLFLDAIAHDKAIFLQDDALHNAWVNSRALELMGITKNSPDPVGGRIGRDASGIPNGLLYETAAKQAQSLIPAFTLEQNIKGAVKFSHIAAGFGITGAKAAGMYESELAGVQVADQRGLLKVHLGVSLRTPDGSRSKPLDYAHFELLRDQYRSEHVDTSYIKIFLDGVPTSARTAAMLKPYMANASFPDGFDGGPILIDPEVLQADLIELDRRGFTVKLHTGGDRSVRLMLDAVEAARRANGDSGLRHEASHAGYIAPEDIERFVSLNAVADLAPLLWAPSPIIDSIMGAVGPERGPKYFPIATLLQRGVLVLAGSDWPAAAASANPWPSIEAMVTRQDPTGNRADVLWPEQAISLASAIHIHTQDGARSLRKEKTIGSIKVGKSADLIVLNHNLFTVAPGDISETRVMQTWFEGELVFEQNSD